MNGEVVLIVDRGLKLLRVQENVLTDEKVGRMFVILDEEVVQSVGSLNRGPSTQSCNEKYKRTGSGPSSKLSATTPEGASQISPGMTHLYVEEQTVALLGS